MSSDSSFKLTTKLVQKRLSLILDHHFSLLTLQEQSHPSKLLTFNESLLEDWCQILTSMVYFKQRKKIPAKPTNVLGPLKEEHSIQPILCLPPQKSELQTPNLLFAMQKNELTIMQVKKPFNKGDVSFQNHKLEFKKGTLHRYCTITTIDSSHVFLIGGCRESDPNLKSKDILHLNLVSKEIVQIAQLPFGVSSHATVKVRDSLFIVGGNKNFNVVTKKCVSINLLSKEVRRVSDLNYPSASHSLLNWKQKFIYKFGGLGNCFGEWDLSPYIQRYSVERQEWEIINPSIKIDQNLLHHYSLMISSLAYVSNRESIVLLGGFDFQQRGSTKMFEIAIKEDEAGDNLHEIVSLGSVIDLQPGGFPSQEWVQTSNELFTFQTVEDGKEGLTAKIVRIGKGVKYF